MFPLLAFVADTVGPSPANLWLASALYAGLGSALARWRWWAGLPWLLFLALTLAASLRRLDEPHTAAALLRAFGPHYLSYHLLATALAAGAILYAMRAQRRSRRAAKPAAPAV